MASAITFSGFNDIDFGVVLNTLMAQASAPLTALQSRQTALRSQVSTFEALTSRLSAVRAAAAALDDAGALSGIAGTSSNPAALGVSAGATALPGEYEVVINQIARAQVTATASSSPDADTTVVASGGTITIGGVAVALAGPTTLQGLADAINDTTGVGVTATVIRTGAANYRLALTSTLTGEANAFTVVNALAGGSGVTFIDTDGDGISGNSLTDNAVRATDASILVNNLPVTSASNILAGVMPGVTLTALKADPTTTIQVSVAPDASALADKVESFVSAYNAAVQFAEEQRAKSNSGDASAIGRDPVLRQLRNSLRGTLLGPHGTGTLTRLTEVGIEFTSTGTLELNRTLFDEAVTADGDAVRGLFGASDGVFPSVTALLDGYTAASGVIRTVKDRLSAQVRSMDTQIASMQGRLALQREAMQKEFIAADQAMSRLKDQMNSLGSLGNWGL